MNKKTLRECTYCKNEIRYDAKVCPICHKHQKWYFEYIAHGISIFLLLLAASQLVLSCNEKSKADDAYREAMQTKQEIKIAEQNILEVSKAVVIISEILPRATGYGAGLTENDKRLLKESIEILENYRAKLNE